MSQRNLDEVRKNIDDALNIVREGLQPHSLNRHAVEKLATAIDHLRQHVEEDNGVLNSFRPYLGTYG